MRYSLIIFFILNTIVLDAQVDPEIIKELKNSTVQILIDGTPSGTGFFVSEKGEIVTNYHVVDLAKLEIDTRGRILNKLEILTREKNKFTVQFNSYYINKGLKDSQAYDYCLLQVVAKSNSTKFPFLKLGSLADIQEGQEILTCGYPFGIDEQFLSKGLLSTKWKEKRYQLNQKETGELIVTDSFYRDVAYLDLTTNKGNSGGAIAIVTKDNRLLVIGIASFILTPAAQQSEELLKKIDYLKTQMAFMAGIDVLAELYNLALATSNNSVGISGLISIDYFKETFGN